MTINKGMGVKEGWLAVRPGCPLSIARHECSMLQQGQAPEETWPVRTYSEDGVSLKVPRVQQLSEKSFSVHCFAKLRLHPG
jgi:hypothetical protein